MLDEAQAETILAPHGGVTVPDANATGDRPATPVATAADTVVRPGGFANRVGYDFLALVRGIIVALIKAPIPDSSHASAVGIIIVLIRATLSLSERGGCRFPAPDRSGVGVCSQGGDGADLCGER